MRNQRAHAAHVRAAIKRLLIATLTESGYCELSAQRVAAKVATSAKHAEVRRG